MRMLSTVQAAVLAGAIPSAFFGCDRATETHSKTTIDDSGAVKKHEESKTTIDMDGNKTVEQKKEVRTDVR